MDVQYVYKQTIAHYLYHGISQANAAQFRSPCGFCQLSTYKGNLCVEYNGAWQWAHDHYDNCMVAFCLLARCLLWQHAVLQSSTMMSKNSAIVAANLSIHMACDIKAGDY